MIHTFTSIRQYESGSIPILVLLILPLLLVMAGLGGDIGKLYVSKAELQSAADACALAAAARIGNTNNNGIILAGQTTATQNKVFFQKDTIQNVDVIVEPDTPQAGFVTCTISKTGITNWITPLLNLIGGDVDESESISARAVATNLPGQTTSALPIGVCDTALANNTPIGKWVEGIVNPGNNNNNNNNSDSTNSLSGSFRWVDLTPSTGTGSSELADILNGEASMSTNIDPANPSISAQGARASVRDDYNTRFGIVKNNTEGTVPDYSGYAYYDGVDGYSKTTGNAFPNYRDVRRPANSKYQGLAPTIQFSGNPTIRDSDYLSKFGADRRIAIAPVVDCATVTFKRFACVFLLHPLPTRQLGQSAPMYLEYLGNPSSQITACNPGTVVGTGNGPKVSALVQ